MALNPNTTTACKHAITDTSNINQNKNKNQDN